MLSLPKTLPQAAQLIAEEVANNHLVLKPMEVTGESLEEMREYFT